jgi:hypothetical protein
MVFSGAEDSIRMELVSRLDIGADRRVLFQTGLWAESGALRPEGEPRLLSRSFLNVLLNTGT